MVVFGNNMYRENEYFKKVLNVLGDYNLLYNVKNDIINQIDIQEYIDYLSFDCNILELCRKEFSFGFESIAIYNCKKYYIAAECFAVADMIYPRTAAYFTLLGCILDFLIDEGENELRDFALNCLKWDNCKKYFIRKTMANSNSVIDIIFAELSTAFDIMKKVNFNKYCFLINKLEKAIKSQIYVSTNLENLHNKEISLITDKSVIFSEIGIIISAFPNNDYRIYECANAIGNCFMLIDDICDLYKDIANNRYNFLTTKYANNESNINSILDRIINDIENIIQNIVNQMNRIRINSNEYFYNFILYEIRHWSKSIKKNG
ncbi:MAG: DUF5685 family protein [Lachnospirales bacterium]